MNLLKNVLFSKDEVDGGVLTAEEIAKNKELEETKKEDVEEQKEVPEEQPKSEIKEDEETITLTKAELEEIKKQKYAEGARKATKTVQNPEADILAIQEELKQLRAEKIASKIVDSKYQEDLVAIAKGKGLEITESNLQEIVKKYPEWLKNNQANKDTITIGGSSGKTAPGTPNEKEQAKKLFGNN